MLYVMFSISIFLIFILYLVYSHNQHKKIELQKKIEEKQEQERIKKLELLKINAEEEQRRENEEKRKAKEAWEKHITGKCEPIRLSFYDTHNLDYKMTAIYKKVIHNNLWINEPFHSKFYEFLMLLNDNNFMIIDPCSKIITMNVRDKHNKMQTSKSYQVYSTKDIVKYMIFYCMEDITRFNKKDAQSLVISIFIVALKQSVHYLSREVPQIIIDKILKGYEQASTIKNIIKLVEAKSEQVYFIKESLYDAFSMVETFSYNDSQITKALEIRQEAPQKFLQHI
jgi:hypothetical protein